MIYSNDGLFYSYQNCFQRPKDKMLTIKLVKNLNTKLYSEHDQFYKIYIGTCTSTNAFGRASKFETETSSLEWEDKVNIFFLFHTSLYFPRFL